jgi:hypothetical protein
MTAIGSYLNPEQAARFHRFFDGRTYRYETNRVHCDLPLTDFLWRLKHSLNAEVFAKGRVVSHILRGVGTRLSDLDIQFDVKDPNWEGVNRAVLDALLPFTRLDCGKKGGRKVRTLVQDENNSFAIHTLPTFIGGSPQDLDLTILKKAQNSCFCSADAVQISLETLFKPKEQEEFIELRAVDGYDVASCLKYMRRSQFFVEPLERVGTLLNANNGFCRLVSRGYRPKDRKTEREFLRAFTKEDKTLLTYLAKHYPGDPEGQIIYCLNYFAALERSGANCPDTEEALFQQICIALGVSPRDCSPEERKSFPNLAQYYLYLRASGHVKRTKEGNLFFAVDRKEEGIPSSNHLYICAPSNSLERAHLAKHSLFNRLKEFFPWEEPPLEENPEVEELPQELSMQMVQSSLGNKKEALRLYRSREEDLIKDPKGLEYLTLFLKELYPAHLKDLTPWLPLLAQETPLEILVLLSKHPQVLALHPALRALFIAKSSLLKEPPLQVREVLARLRKVEKIEQALEVYPEEISFEEVKELRALCKEFQKNPKVLPLHLHLLALSVRENASIEQELSSLLSKKTVKAVMESDLLVALLDRVDVFKRVCALLLSYCDGELRAAISMQSDLIGPLSLMQARLTKDDLSLLMNKGRRIAEISESKPYWRPIRQKLFEMARSIRPDFQTADEFFIKCKAALH